MSVIRLADYGLKLGPDCGWGQQRYDLVSTSDETGSEQTRLKGVPRWTLSLVQPAWLTLAEGGAWQAMVVALRGKVNRLEAYDPVRLAPQGTARGALTLSADVAAGASTIGLSGARAGNNLLYATEDLTADVWFGGTTVTANVATAPSGAGNGDLISAGSAGLSCSQYTPSIASGVAVTLSGSFKRSGGSTHVLLGFGSGSYGWFNLQTGAVGSNSQLGTATTFSGLAITAQGNGWYRCALTATTTGTGNLRCAILPTSGDTLGSASGDQIYAWGIKAAVEAAPSAYEGLPTLKPGDLLRIGSGLGTSQCVMAMGPSDTVADPLGNMTVPIEAPPRIAFASGTAVAWDKPTAFFRARGGSASSWKYGNRGTTQVGLSLDLIETWT